MVILKQFMAILFLTITFGALPFAQEEKTKRGRYWGEVDKLEESAKKKPEETKAPEPPQRNVPLMPSHAQLMSMHPESIRALFVQMHEYHVMRPTLETAANVLLLKDVMSKKSRAAASVEALARLKNPQLTGSAEYQHNPTARSAQQQEKNRTIRTRLIKENSGFAMVVLTQRNCAACVIHKKTLGNFQRSYDWTIKEIDIREEPLAAAHFNAQVTPVTIIVSKASGEWMPISTGADPLSTLTFNTFQGVRYLQGEISAAQWHTAPGQQDSLFDPEFNPEITPLR